MNPTDRCQRLSHEILVCFGDGITIDACTQGYIDACLPGLSMEALAQRISRPPDLDTAPLMDLIFFPDEAFQLRLEPLLETEAYEREDEATVAALLEAEKIHTTLRETGRRKDIVLQVPPSVLTPFVGRLNISRHIPATLNEAINAIHPPETAVRLKVMVRNSQFSLTGAAADFLKAFLLGIDSGSEAFIDCFKQALDLVDVRGNETDPFRLLRLKTDSLHRARQAAFRFEKQLQRNNMETLMHQGIRAPEMGAAEAEEKIALLDRIGRAVAIGGCDIRRSAKT